MKCTHCTNHVYLNELCYPHYLATQTPRMNWEIEFDKQFEQKQAGVTNNA